MSPRLDRAGDREVFRTHEDSVNETVKKRLRERPLASRPRVENHTRAIVAATAAVLPLAGCAGPRTASPIPGDVIVYPAVETAPTPSDDDAADDPAIWVHPNDPARSLILGSDKAEGLGIYDLRGARVGFLAVGSVNNVDVSVFDAAGGEIHPIDADARGASASAVEAMMQFSGYGSLEYAAMLRRVDALDPGYKE